MPGEAFVSRDTVREPDVPIMDAYERDDEDGHDPFERDAEQWWELEE